MCGVGGGACVPACRCVWCMCACMIGMGVYSGVATGGGGAGGNCPPWLWKMENSEICHLGENDTQLQCGFGF